jgi:hypothetical protein
MHGRRLKRIALQHVLTSRALHAIHDKLKKHSTHEQHRSTTALDNQQRVIIRDV